MSLAYATPETMTDGARRGRAASMEALGLAGLGLLLFFVSVLSVQFARSEALTAIWPTNAIALVAVLRSRWTRENIARLCGVIGVALAAPLLLGGVPIWATALITAGNLTEILAAAWLTRRLLGRDVSVAGLGQLMKLLLAAAVVAPLISATITTPVFAAIPEVLGGQSASFQLWLEAFLSDALGMMLFAPFGLAFRARDLVDLNLRRRLEGLGIWLLIAVSAVWVFGQDLILNGGRAEANLGDLMSLMLVTPLLILAALRFGVVGAAAAALTVAVVALGFSAVGEGPIAELPGLSAQDKLYWLQLYIAVVGLSVLPVAAVLRDRDRYASELARHRRRAEAASEGKSRLLANVSHEIKSPVGGIIGIGELWASGKLGPVTSTQAEMAEMLVRTARQIEALAYDLLDVSRAESGAVSVNLRPVDLKALVEDVRQSLSMKYEDEGLRWVVDAPEDRLVATADSVRLSQILTNLVTNAVKYGKSGGVVIMRLSRPSENVVRVEVVDRGPGIAPERQAELFEPFNRLGMDRTTIEGHGIGLALARRLAELQGASLGFESRPGEGARFWVDLRPAEA